MDDKEAAELWRTLVENDWGLTCCECFNSESGEPYWEWTVLGANISWYPTHEAAIRAALEAKAGGRHD